jgi:hypothetical protein
MDVTRGNGAAGCRKHTDRTCNDRKEIYIIFGVGSLVQETKSEDGTDVRERRETEMWWERQKERERATMK